MSALIELRDVLVRRGARKTLEVASLDVDQGQVLALVGPNGAGKTTLLLLLAGLLRPEAGTVSFHGRPLSEWDLLEYRRKTSFVFQAPLLLDMTVADNVALGMRFRGAAKEKVRAQAHYWLAQLGIAHLAGRRAAEVSGGEAQRVSLARAFVLDPELLLLDEPFSGLDPPARTKLLADLGALLHRRKSTVVIVTHDLSEAALLGDRVGVVVGGALRQVGPARQIKSHPVDADVAAFIRSLPRSGGR